jgi:FlaA1/EpsC-like NDP-sugar epimerase
VQGTGRTVAFIDDDPRKMRKTFQGLKVLGTRYDIEALARLYHVDHVLIAKNDIPIEDVKHIKSLCEQANVTYEVFTLAN